jgi:hypothetical protein
MGPADEVLDPADEGILVSRFLRFRHVTGYEHPHLVGVIERGTHLELERLLAADPVGDVVEGRVADLELQRGAGGLVAGRR